MDLVWSRVTGECRANMFLTLLLGRSHLIWFGLIKFSGSFGSLVLRFRGPPETHRGDRSLSCKFQVFALLVPTLSVDFGNDKK